MISDARGGHVSPGIYTEEKDVTYSVKSLGITSLGVVGETLYGPAFQEVEIKDYGEFTDYFGGTSTEKFKGTGLPKYELPYIAKSYLEESKKLHVVRVLGLSGYDAGAAWVCAKDKDKSEPIVVLRSKLQYKQNEGNICTEAKDAPTVIVDSIEVTEYAPKVWTSECVESASTSNPVTDNYKFGLKVTLKKGIVGWDKEYNYNVSLNPQDSDYIYNVLSDRADAGTSPIYIEAVYEAAFDGKSKITECTKHLSATVDAPSYLKIVKTAEVDASGKTVCTVTSINEAEYLANSATTSDALKKYFEKSVTSKIAIEASEMNGDEAYIQIGKTTIEDYYRNFKEMYRPAQTPWVISDVAASTNGDVTTASMRKLFKFITISDGDAANYQVKVSITNIKPKEGTFDVVVRDFNDTDDAPIVLEKFSRCNLVAGDTNYIAYKIGTSDGGFVAKSKFITVEMAEQEDFGKAIPAGFLGYPTMNYGNHSKTKATYNKSYIKGRKAKRQYFGFSNIIGVDSDLFKYKGVNAYTMGDAEPSMLGNGFHLDSILAKATSANTIVDGVSGYIIDSVSTEKVGTEAYIPRIINAPYMEETIYKDIDLRKFTVCFYGGFDGWDINREQRTNTDKYKATAYNVNGSKVFSSISDNGLNLPLDLPSTAITTDYYAYLAGYRVFANPQDVDINLFATPGIDWYNNRLLVEDAIDIIEDTEDGRGGDALYIMSAPSEGTPREVAEQFDDAMVNTSYACTYYPWVMHYDSSNKRYINLPVTKDAVRNMAATDNNSYPWFAPAGIERGDVQCVKATYKTTLSDEDILYNANINPVKSFSQDGVKIWGNKTAYDVESPLNRINVRRLMIRVKKLVKDAALKLIFEQYDDTLEKQFKSIVDPILANVKANRGIYDYRIVTEVTEETRDQHILPAKILIKPTPALEYISISFVVYPESISFDEN